MFDITILNLGPWRSYRYWYLGAWEVNKRGNNHYGYIKVTDPEQYALLENLRKHARITHIEVNDNTYFYEYNITIITSSNKAFYKFWDEEDAIGYSLSVRDSGKHDLSYNSSKPKLTALYAWT